MNSGNGHQPDDKVKIQCPCGQVFSVKMPIGERVNTLRVSQFVACHDRPVKCPTCAQAFALGIHSVLVRWEAAPITPEQLGQLEESRILKPT